MQSKQGEARLRLFAEAPLTPAAQILQAALAQRQCRCEFTQTRGLADLLLCTDTTLDRDACRIEAKDGRLILTAAGIRGAIFACGRYLRSLAPSAHGPAPVRDLTGSYAPLQPIRGHQLGYRPLANTYDAWTAAQYRQYCIELMFFGVNTVEHIPGSARNALMQYDPNALLAQASADAQALDLNLSLWQPQQPLPDALQSSEVLYRTLPRLDAVFIPGADPGKLPPQALMEYCASVATVLKRHHPAAKLWVSAQQPHDQPDWGAAFLQALAAAPQGIDGVIMGPNHAFPLPELRARVPARYPIRFYPDLTHNVRCEYPVHYKADDWHFALAAGLGRECTNPRPREFAALFAETADDLIGFVSYSEGVHDDVNKAVWSTLAYDGPGDVREILKDYARLFFYGADADALADAILGLEENWYGDPAENETIDRTAALLHAQAAAHPFLMENWRFVQLLFRADCDLLLRRRRRFELPLIRHAQAALQTGNLSRAKALLQTPPEADCRALRTEIDTLADRLFAQIGLQLSVQKHGAENPERGAVLDTIDLPTTDRAWLRKQTLRAPDAKTALAAFARNTVAADEFYYSVALHGVGGMRCPQTGEFYLNFRGDDPEENNGDLPTGLLTVYDHFCAKLQIEGLSDGADYRLIVTYREKRDPAVTAHEILANGAVLYCGPQFGGTRAPAFDAPGFTAVSYPFPRGILQNGRLLLELREPRMGVMFAEIRILKHAE